MLSGFCGSTSGRNLGPAMNAQPKVRKTMPFKSAAQRKFLFAKHPKIAKQWARKYGAKVGGGKTKAQKQGTQR